MFTSAAFCVAGAALDHLSFILRGRCSTGSMSREVRGRPATIDYYGRRLLLRGRCSTWSTSASFCVAGAAREGSPDRSVEGRQRLISMDAAAAYAWQAQQLEHISFILRGKGSKWSISASVCVAGAALGASPERSTEGRRRLITVDAGCFCGAGAALGAHQLHFCVAGTALGAPRLHLA